MFVVGSLKYLFNRGSVKTVTASFQLVELILNKSPKLLNCQVVLRNYYILRVG